MTEERKEEREVGGVRNSVPSPLPKRSPNRVVAVGSSHASVLFFLWSLPIHNSSRLLAYLSRGDRDHAGDVPIHLSLSFFVGLVRGESLQENVSTSFFRWLRWELCSRLERDFVFDEFHLGSLEPKAML